MKKITLFVTIFFILLGCEDEKIKNETKQETKIEQNITQKNLQISQIKEDFDAKYIYNIKCKVCHGTDAKTLALGKSRVLANLSENEIILSLIGYQNGTYGGDLKATMKPMVKNLSIDDIKELAKFIKSLN